MKVVLFTCDSYKLKNQKQTLRLLIIWVKIYKKESLIQIKQKEQNKNVGRVYNCVVRLVINVGYV